jgi:hypothetical protein
MKKILTFIVAYSFVIITALQLIANLVFVFNKEFYLKYSFWFSNFSGLSVSYLVPMVAVAFLLKFCKTRYKFCNILHRVLHICKVFINKLFLH